MLQPKDASGGASHHGTISARTQSQIASLTQSGGGRPLSDGVRGYFEPRLGADLSDVRIHTGGDADASARSVNALAFTFGRDIAFRDGQFAPDTHPGRRLLAHELAHVVQQNSGIVGTQRVQRAPAPTTAAGSDFDVVGKSSDTATDLSRIHFDKNSDVVDSDEETKLKTFNSGELTLRAFQSEEETVGLAAKRAANVKSALTSPGIGHPDPAKIHETVVGPTSQVDYRAARVVEIVRAGAKATKGKCPTSPKLADMAVACVNVGRSAPYRAALASARSAIAKSREMLKTDAGKGTPTAATLDIVKKKFAKSSNADKVRTKLGEIDSFLAKIAAITECHNECDSDCNSPAYWDPGRKIMVLCPDFDSFTTPGQAGLVMHEATHGTPTIQSDDLGYSSDRIIDFLDEAHAFKNTDSYTTLVRDLTGTAGFIDPVPADALSGFTTRTIGGVVVQEQDLVKKAEALAEKWCIWVYQDLEFLYGGIRAAISASGGPKPLDGYFKEVMKGLHTNFGLTDETLPPTMADQQAVAGLQDKYQRFGIKVFGPPLTVKPTPGTDTAWGASAPDIPGGQSVAKPNLDIGDDFWTATSDEERAKVIIAALVKATKDTTAAKADKYAEFAFERSRTPDRL